MKSVKQYLIHVTKLNEVRFTSECNVAYLRFIIFFDKIPKDIAFIWSSLLTACWKVTGYQRPVEYRYLFSHHSKQDRY